MMRKTAIVMPEERRNDQQNAANEIACHRFRVAPGEKSLSCRFFLCVIQPVLVFDRADRQLDG